MMQGGSRRAVYPGTFDPITRGHLDIILRGRELFDHVLVAVARSPQKEPLFATEERTQMVRETLANISGVEVQAFDGLLVDFVRSCGARAVLRGLRALSDFEYEFQMALMNKRLAAEIETVFMMTGADSIFVSSSVVREVARLGGDVSGLVPANVHGRILEKFAEK